jgi:hypothetical protein
MYQIVQTTRPERAPIEVVPVTQVHLQGLELLAKADGHGVIYPTHAVMRGDEEIVGYGSLGRVPMFFAWLHSRKLGPRESFEAWRQAEALLKGRGPVCVPCTDGSPLLPFLEKKGYSKVGTAHLFIKVF